MMPVRLTGRGRGIALAGVGLAGAGWLMGSVAVLAGGLFALALTTAAALLTLLLRPGVSIRRVPGPPAAVVHQRVSATAEVTLPRAAAAAVVSGLIPAGTRATEHGPIVLLPPWPGRCQASSAFTCPTRGTYPWPVPEVQVPDPLGIAFAVVNAQDEPTELIVYPVVIALPGLPGLELGEGRGEHREIRSIRRSSDGSATDPVPRAYLPGDDLRRMHWPATARAGQPMVRTEDVERGRAAVIALDCSPDHYTTAEGFERAVTAAASLATALLARDWSVSLRTLDGGLLTPRPWHEGRTGRVAVLAALARVAPGDTGVVLLGSDTAALRWVVQGSRSALPLQQGPVPTLVVCTEQSAQPVRDCAVWDGSTDLAAVLRSLRPALAGSP